MAYNYGNKESVNIPTATPTAPCAEPNFVDVVWASVDEINFAVSRLENIRAMLSPGPAEKNVQCSPKQPGITFDYVWGILPETLSSLAYRIFDFCAFTKEMVYKNPGKEDCANSVNPSNHVEKVAKSIDLLVQSVDALESLPNNLIGNLCPSGCGDEAKKEPTFAQIWRDLPSVLSECVSKIRKIEVELSSMFLSQEKPSEKHR